MRNQFEQVDNTEYEEHDFRRIPIGRDIEGGVLGIIRKGSYEGYNSLDYIPFDEAVRLVKEDEFQPEKKPFPADLSLQIANDLNVYLRQIEYYTAIGSPLDKFHGVDAFLELNLGDGQIIRITLDITSNLEKINHKANVVFHWPKDGIDRKTKEGKDAWDRIIKEVSLRIEEFIKVQAHQRGLDIQTLDEEELKKVRQLKRKPR